MHQRRVFSDHRITVEPTNKTGGAGGRRRDFDGREGREGRYGRDGRDGRDGRRDDRVRRGPSPSDKCFKCNETGHW